MDPRPRAAVVTISDGVTHGTREDASGDLASELMAAAGFEVAERVVIPDERDRIEDTIRTLAAMHAVVITTGGTGFGPRDVTPEATRAVLDREAPGLAELMREAGRAHTAMAALSRGVVGTVGSALVVNLPGSPAGCVRDWRSSCRPGAPRDRADAGRYRGTPHRASPERRGSGTGRAARMNFAVEAKAVKVHGAPPCQVGNAMTIVPGGAVHGTLGCAEFDMAAVEAAAEVAASGRAETRILTHDLGQVEVYFEPAVPARRVVVVSATDVARALRTILGTLGYRVDVVEPRRERITAEDGATLASLERMSWNDRTAVVFTDHDAPGVTDDLATLLRSPVGFIGVMGSRRHVAHVRRGAPCPRVRRRASSRGSARRSASTSADASPDRSRSRSQPESSRMRTGGTGAGSTAPRRTVVAFGLAMCAVVAAASCPGWATKIRTRCRPTY